MQTDHEELARRIESEQPSRELDCAIAVQALGWLTRPNKGWPEETDYGYRKEDGGEVWPGHGGDQMVPRYTTSVDAALSLVPEGWVLWLLTDMQFDGLNGCELANPPFADKAVSFGNRNLAQAVTAAALRARALKEAK